MVYEDSEGDLNVISEDDDLKDAYKYAQAKQQKLQAVILEKETFARCREE